MKRLFIVLILVQALIIYSASLWNSSTNNQFKNIVGDRKANKVGDIVTIVVKETPKINATSENTAFENALLNLFTGAVKNITQFDLSQFIPINNNSTQQRSAQLSSTVTLTVSAVVVDVQNGNLIVEGNKKLKVGEQLSEIIIRGTVRPDDIASDNTVDSSKIANCQIWVNGQLVFRQNPDQESWLDYILSAIAKWFL
ncbi:flagellar basal body L-ring protein FlgH [Thermotoga profunda]|uniref:flagellar basal body L-ring protein FlgH n=1 Tax=Thermotoga profunda TaxID=1508420 RepID=UPI000596E112|nr:flagellar basal body L-ring protein FlgH [Thermotoga profunda]